VSQSNSTKGSAPRRSPLAASRFFNQLSRTAGLPMRTGEYTISGIAASIGDG
jgi:hypothetical protein